MDKSKRKDKGGVISIEASLVLSIFIFAALIIYYMSMSIMIQTVTQDLLNKTSLELSSYLHLAEKMNIKQDRLSQDHDEILESVNNLFTDSKNLVNDMSSDIKEAGNKIKNYDFSIDLDSLSKYDKQVQNIEEQLDSLSNRPEEIVSLLSDSLKLSMGEQLKVKLVLTPISKLLMKKYIDGDMNDYLSKVGIVNGSQGLNLSLSTINKQNNLNMVLAYKIKFNGFNLMNNEYFIKQNANLKPWTRNFLTNEDEPDYSIWLESNFIRGRYFANKIREDYSSIAIKSGQGLDLLDKDKKKISQVYSMNIFSPTYSKEVDGVYQINSDNLYKQIKTYSDKLKQNIKKSKFNLIMQDGREEVFDKTYSYNLLLILPEEAKMFSKELLLLKDDFIKEGVELDFIYKERIGL